MSSGNISATTDSMPFCRMLEKNPAKNLVTIRVAKFVATACGIKKSMKPT